MTLDQVVRVLLVEDEPDDHQTIVELLGQLEEYGHRYRIAWVKTFAEGLAAIRGDEHDVCVLDYGLGPHDGLEFLAEVAGTAIPTPIIFLTGLEDDGVEQAALSAGAADYLIKGELDAAMLERSIRHSLDRARSVGALRDRERQFRAVFETALDAMVIADDAGRCVDGNDAALALLGVDRAAFLTMRMADLAPPAAAADPDQWWRVLVTEHRSEGEIEVTRRDGVVRTVELRANASFLPGRHLAVMRDVTDRRVAEGHQRRLAAAVKLPPAAPATPPRTAAPADVPTRACRRGRVLVIDDDPLIGKAVRRGIAAVHDVTLATSAAEALESLRSGLRFDVLLCDMMMPEMTGMDFYEALREKMPAHLPRLVFLTGGAFTPGASEFLDRVPNRHIEKPFEVARLRALVSEMVASVDGDPG